MMTHSDRNLVRPISTQGVEMLSPRRKGLMLLSSLLFLTFVFSFQTLEAQTYTINTADDLSSAVTTINGLGLTSTILFNTSTLDLASLTSPLGTLKYDTLLEGDILLTNSTMGATMSLNSTALMEIGSGSTIGVTATGNFGQDTNGNGYAGNVANVTTGSLAVDSGVTFGILGGAGSDSAATTDVLGGNGGAASLSASSTVLVDSSFAGVAGGNGGNSAGGNGGNGGNASASVGSTLTLDSNTGNGAFIVQGGTAGENTDADGTGLSGTGGNATLTVSGAVSVDSSPITVAGGSATEGYGASGATEGAGGNAWVSMGNGLTMTSENYYNGNFDGNESGFDITGGNGGNDGNLGNGGVGGNATLLSSGAVSLDSSYMDIFGGTGGSANWVNGGNGGNALFSVNSGLTLTSAYVGSDLELGGGDGGESTWTGASGNGGNGTLSVSGAVSIDSGTVDVYGGDGGESYAGTGGTGGNASVSMGNDLTLTSNNQIGYLYVWGGEGGFNDDYGSGVGTKGGAATLTVAGAVSIDSASMEVTAGEGDYGYGAMGTTEGAGGNAWASIGGALNETSENYYNGNNNGEESAVSVDGGDGAYDYYLGNAGNGGNATLLLSSAVSVDSSELYVEGGEGGESYAASGGNGGNASLSLGNNLTLTSTYTYGDLEVIGGESGYNDDDADGLSGTGGNANLTVAGAVSMDSAYMEVEGGEADEGYGGVGTTEGAGGNAWTSIGGALNLTSESYYNGNSNDEESELLVEGGEGAYDYNFANGGNGGNGTLLLSSAVSVDSSELYVYGGDAEESYSGIGGNGGNATLSMGNNLTLTSTYAYGDLEVVGGEAGYNDGGDGYNVGGNGGNATLSVAGAVSVDSGSVSVDGGDGDYGEAAIGEKEGMGGNAWTSIGGAFNLNSENYYNGTGKGEESEFVVEGGEGAYDDNYGNGGNGGNATLLLTGPVSVDSSELDVYGGDGNYSYYGKAGNGGNAYLSLGNNLTLSSTYAESSLEVIGGYGNSNYAYYYGYYGSDAGGNGGNATLSVAGAVSVDSSSITVEGGEAYYSYDYGVLGTSEGAGGNAWASIGGALNLTSENYYNGTGKGQESELYISGGEGGYPYETESYANGGNGGNATLLVSGPVSVDSSEFSVEGGDGETSYGGNGGNGGNASLTLGSNLNVTSTYAESYFDVSGGYGYYNDDYANGVGGSGGSATLSVAGAVSIDSASMEVTAGPSSYGYGLLNMTANAGGNAWTSIGGALNMTSDNYYVKSVGGESNLYVAGSDAVTDYYLASVQNGGNATLLVSGPVSVDSSYIEVESGAGGGAYNGNGGNGGTASMVLNHNLTLTSTYAEGYLELVGGEGGYNDEYDGYGYGVGGSGGNATLSVAGAVSVDSGYVSVGAGEGDYGYGTPDQTEGAGGNASVTMGSLALTSENYYNGTGKGIPSEIDIYGGSGAYDYNYANGGSGGNATLSVSGPTSIDSSDLYIYGGAGEYSYSATGGNGGNASLTLGNNLTLSSTYAESNLEVVGGEGGYNDDSEYGVSGNGGNATLSVAGAVSVDSGFVSVGGGDGYYGYGSLTATEGIGGNASASMADLTVTNSQNMVNASFNIYAGVGAYDDYYGNGGQGGNASLTVSGAVSVDDSTLNIAAGVGGTALYYNAGTGGNASLKATSVSLNNNATIEVEGGNGASGGSINSNGGNATLSLGSLNLVDSGSSVDLYAGDPGGSGAVYGMANATIGTLTGAGYIDLYGNTGSALNVTSGDFSGTIEGDAALDKTGSGALTLTSANVYTGGTNVNDGTLDVANSSALGTGDVSVNGGTLAGNGGPLPINVTGNYAQGSTGTLQLGIAGLTAGDWDTLEVTGTTSLGGTLKLTTYSGFKPAEGESFDMVDSTGTMTGEFSAVSDTFFMPVSAIYGSNSVTLQTLSFSDFGTTANEKVVASLLDSYAGTSTNGALSALITSVPNSKLPTIFNELSPTALTPMYQIGFSVAANEASLIDQRLDALFGMSLMGSDDVSSNYGESPMFASTLPADQEAAMAAGASSGNQSGVFVMGNGNFGTINGDSNADGYNYTTTGITAGVDTKLAPDLVGGVLLGYDTSNTTQSNNDSVTMKGGQMGLYAGWREEGLHVEALVDGGINSYNTQRGIANTVALGTTQGVQYGGQLGAGYDFNLGDGAKLGPFATGQYTYVQLNSYQEQGSPADLSIPSQGEGAMLSDLGARASKNWKLDATTSLSPNVSVAWEHVYQGNQDSMSANLAGSTFATNGVALGTDGVVVSAGLDAQFAHVVTVFGQYQGKIGITNYDSQSVAGGVKLAF